MCKEITDDDAQFLDNLNNLCVWNLPQIKKERKSEVK